MDIHFNSYKVKYTQLDDLFNPIFRSVRLESINIFINLDDIFHKLHRPSTNIEFQMSGENAGKQVISNVMNIIAHYRQWAVRKNLQTRVIAFYTSSITGSFKNKIYIPSYRKRFKDINHPLSADFYFINQGIRDAEKLFRIMSQYIDKIYIIDSRFLEPSIIPEYFTENIFNASWNVIVSRDEYDMQYAYKDKWSYIYPKGENTRIINKSNLWEVIGSLEKITNLDMSYEPSLYPLLYSVIGDQFRNIPRIKRVGWKTLFKILERVSKYSKDKSFTSLQLLLCQELTNKNITTETITNNLNCVDIDSQVARLGEIDKADIESQIIDIPDYENLVELNNLYFKKYPINLVFLTEQKENIKYNKNPFGV